MVNKTGTTIYISNEALKSLKDTNIKLQWVTMKTHTDKILALCHMYNNKNI